MNKIIQLIAACIVWFFGCIFILFISFIFLTCICLDFLMYRWYFFGEICISEILTLFLPHATKGTAQEK